MMSGNLPCGKVPNPAVKQPEDEFCIPAVRFRAAFLLKNVNNGILQEVYDDKTFIYIRVGDRRSSRQSV